jgi:glycosyltransferase involved in cell wall biosynthesis
MSPSNGPHLTLAMIVANDVAGLQRTLDSVGAQVDEIVVCDTGEDEAVTQCAQAHGARAVQHPWCDSFSVARNECLRHVQGKWILWLDAGETISVEDLIALRQQLQGTEPHTAFMLLVKAPRRTNRLLARDA